MDILLFIFFLSINVMTYEHEVGFMESQEVEVCFSPGPVPCGPNFQNGKTDDQPDQNSCNRR